MTIAEIVAEKLLEIRAVFLRPGEPFIWASGIKSPIYCDNRLTLSYPEIRKIIENGLADIIKAEYPTCEVIMGTSTAGIPHAAIVADILGLPMGYVRADNKTHGRTNRIEGLVPTDKDVVVIEDLISTAGSAIDVVNALRDEGANVLGIVSIFTYQLPKGVERLAENNVKNISLSNINVLAKVAVKKDYITEREYEMVLKFLKEPSSNDWFVD